MQCPDAIRAAPHLIFGIGLCARMEGHEVPRGRQRIEKQPRIQQCRVLRAVDMDEGLAPLHRTGQAFGLRHIRKEVVLHPGHQLGEAHPSAVLGGDDIGHQGGGPPDDFIVEYGHGFLSGNPQS